MSPKQKIAPNCNFFAIRDRRDGANPAKDESHTHRNQGMHLQSDKKTARRRFRSQIYGWASRIPALCERSPPWRKRLQANP